MSIVFIDGWIGNEYGAIGVGIENDVTEGEGDGGGDFKMGWVVTAFAGANWQ